MNVRVAGDVAAAERDLRAIWGGALCVTAAERSYAELAAIQQEIDATAEEIGLTTSNVDEVTGSVEVEVVVDHAGLQAHFDDRHGREVVRVVPWLVATG